MDKDQLRALIEETLQELGRYSPEATELLMGTCAQESHLGQYIQQLGGGPAVGIFQMEPATFEDVINNYLQYRPETLNKIKVMCSIDPDVFIDADILRWNIKLAICFTRMFYFRINDPIPLTTSGQATYWKTFYNTKLGKGTKAEYLANYKKLC